MRCDTRAALLAAATLAAAACGPRSGAKAAAEPAPSPAAEPAPAASAPEAAPAADPRLRLLLLTADIAVVGEVTISACRGGCLGKIRISEVVAGEASERELDFTTEPPVGGVSLQPERVLAFLHRDPTDAARWRLVLTAGREVGLDPARAAEVRSAKVPRATEPADRAAFADDLATLREHDQSKWNGSMIVDPASRVFQNLDLRGMTQDELTALIGAPVRRGTRADRAVWSYTFHDGEQGVMPQVWWADDGTVVHVNVMYGE